MLLNSSNIIDAIRAAISRIGPNAPVEGYFLYIDDLLLGGNCSVLSCSTAFRSGRPQSEHPPEKKPKKSSKRVQ